MARSSEQTHFCRRYEKRAAENRLISHAASLRTVVQICILTAAMFTAPAVAALKHWQEQQKRSDIPFAGPPDPLRPPRLFTESGEPLGAGLSRHATTFTDPGSSALRSLLGLLFLTLALPNERQGASRLFVCLFGASSY